MSKTINILAIILLAQLVLAAGLWVGNSGISDANPAQSLLALDFSQVNKIVIDDDEKKTTLQQVEQAWQLPDYRTLAANGDKVTELLEKLKSLQAGWPVATTDSAAERFTVTEDDAQKKIVLYHDDEMLSTLYLGTSPSFRKLHVRVDDKSEIYAVTFAHHETPIENSEWFDKGLLQMPVPIKQVSSDKFKLTQDDEQWTVSPTNADKSANNEAIKTWVERFSSLQVDSLVEEEIAAEILKETTAFSVSLEGLQGETKYDFYKKNENHYVKSSKYPHLFKIISYQATPLLSAEVSGFLKDKQVADNVDNKEDPEEEAAPQDNGAG